MAGFLRILILLGALQGFILSALLIFSKRNKQSNRLLGSLILLMALASMNLYLIDEKWIDASTVLLILSYIIPMVIIMPLGPLIYFYIRSLSDPSFVFSRKYRFHFYPVIIDIIPQLAAFIYIGGLAFSLLIKNDAPWGDFIDGYNVYSDIPRWISITSYLWLSYRYLKLLKLKSATGSEEPVADFKWQRQFLGIFIVFQFIWLIFLVPYIIPSSRYKLLDTVGWYPIYIPLSILIYWLGIKGFLLSHAQNKPNRKLNNALMLPEPLVQNTIFSLEKAMESDKLYLNPSLNLSLLATHTGIPPKIISAVLNQHLLKSFNEYVNGYRIRDIKERLLLSSDKNLTIAGLAYECGFNSQPTFQRAFKAVTGQNPREFIAQNV